jgi:hypothetical protein
MNQSISTGTFFGEFFKVAPKELSPLQKVSRRCGNHIWSFLKLTDVLNLSATSKASLALKISVANIHNFLGEDERLQSIGNFRIAFASDTTIGLLKSMLYRVVTGKEGVLTIDGSTGRVLLDIGSAFSSQDTFLSAMVTAIPVDDEPVPTIADHPILKQFERASFDEYDDYNPRHPMMNKSHRRGCSYFNSDIEEVATEALKPQYDGNDLSTIAELAMNSLEDEAAEAENLRKSQSISEKARALRAKKLDQ